MKGKWAIAIYSFVIGVLFGLSCAYVYYDSQEAKPGILISYNSQDISWDVSENKIKEKFYQKYVARNKDDEIVLMLKSPPIELWVGEWR